MKSAVHSLKLAYFAPSLKVLRELRSEAEDMFVRDTNSIWFRGDGKAAKWDLFLFSFVLFLSVSLDPLYRVKGRGSGSSPQRPQSQSQ
jgi:hypothetical protein